MDWSKFYSLFIPKRLWKQNCQQLPIRLLLDPLIGFPSPFLFTKLVLYFLCTNMPTYGCRQNENSFRFSRALSCMKMGLVIFDAFVLVIIKISASWIWYSFTFVLLSALHTDENDLCLCFPSSGFGMFYRTCRHLVQLQRSQIPWYWCGYFKSIIPLHVYLHNKYGVNFSYGWLLCLLLHIKRKHYLALYCKCY